ncbi:anaerobic ribonucleoside-triphosphate reductase activating protein [Corynebacterium uterequi]|uniref:Anaerobic ribonucleoside-triphosphate reductase activating protein n=1 Tax=Corynebacterium uterequi TaxID=1072256 RepID=A0A0G3HEJ8_9CORY|nr:anaerobic ribonucleoside-triphosphate reductase activating protein [Corynebacterium uterequi]AKK11714.1 anaerobic ribonucleoside-triphosphate reductase activating protein [Corynebacterium uterequi]
MRASSTSNAELLRAPNTPPKRLERIARADARSASWAERPEVRVADYKPFQALDGEGLRCSLYVSYCPFNCLGCYNKAAQKASYGVNFTAELEQRIVDDLGSRHVAGLSLLGGEPMLSAPGLLPLVRRIKRECPGKTIWTYTGYRFEVLAGLPGARAELLHHTDVLVDGQFIAEERDPANPPAFAGSANQRLVDVSASLAAGTVVEYRP